MRKQWWFSLLVGLALSIGLIANARVVQAEGAGFTVTPSLPANQIGGNSGYFNLLVKPGTKQALTVTLVNTTDAPKQLAVSVTDAYTQENGKVAYDPHSVAKDGAVVRLSQISSPSVNVNLIAHQGRTVTLYATIPASGWAGQVLGGIYVRDLTDSSKQSSGQLAVQNAFSMVVGVQLQTSAELVAPVLKMPTVTVGRTNQKPALLAHLQNASPRLFGGMTVTTKVTKQGAKGTLLTRTAKDQQMAPNSSYDFAVPSDTALTPGRYAVDVTAVAGAYRWHFKRTVTINETAAAKANQVPGAPVDKTGWVWWLMAGIVLAVGLLILIIIRRRRHNETT